eukprot:TRINITY_DN10097_c0_g1_i8.p2 TRINITY_DN10097_c0_g1~~TRINITY_DN10097_c0_g1_i8.p2  ORF type:complete len:120 (-),score=27.50 TRINITY_DN10097_c0_g1_i8:13-372(-)
MEDTKQQNNEEPDEDEKEMERRRQEIRNEMKKRREEDKEETKLSQKRAFPEDYVDEEDQVEKGIEIVFPNKLCDNTLEQVSTCSTLISSFPAHSLCLSLIHICRCRRYAVCRSRWSPYH